MPVLGQQEGELSVAIEVMWPQGQAHDDHVPGARIDQAVGATPMADIMTR